MGKPRPPAPAPCPCGGGRYSDCCEPLHEGKPAPDAASLMRSRYSAYALGLTGYLLASWHPDTRPASLELDAATRWLDLRVLRHETGDKYASVEFIARCRIQGRGARLHETSRFQRIREHWYYLDGVLHDT